MLSFFAPSTTRESAMLGVGLVGGALIAKTLLSSSSNVSVTTPTRVFKLAVANEVASFDTMGKIDSSLDKADGFVHLSDRTSPPKVASLFFKGAKDLHLLELDATKLAGPISWVCGAMGDSPPADVGASGTTVHYLVADGCVHVYGAPVATSCIVRRAKVPLGKDGVHVFPEWL